MNGRMHWLMGLVLLLGTLANRVHAEQAMETRDPRRIEVITDSVHPITGLESLAARLAVQVFDLDSPARLEAQLSEGLPEDVDTAARLARQRLNTLGRQSLAGQFARAYTGLLKALDYGIDRYPAVVFDGGESVVYGVVNLDEALDHYRRWCSLRGER